MSATYSEMADEQADQLKHEREQQEWCDLDQLCAEALRRLHKAIDARWQIARGRAPQTARRSVGQIYRRREQGK